MQPSYMLEQFSAHENAQRGTSESEEQGEGVVYQIGCNITVENNT